MRRGLRARRVLPALVAVAALGAGCAADPDDGQPRSDRPAPAASSAAADPDAPAATTDRRRSSTELRAPRPARSAARLAARIVAAEETVRSPTASAAERDQAAFDSQVLHRQLGRRPGWRPRVLRAVGADLRPTVRAYLTARDSLRGMHTTLSSTLPAWRIVDPPPLRRLRRHYREGERRFGVPAEVLAAVNLVETRMGRIRGTSVAGARGPMQFMPATWEAFGRGDIDDPRDAILAAARYLAHNGGGRGRVDDALFAYNRHRGYVRAVQAYAEVIRSHPRALAGLHDWQVLYLSTAGDVWLPTGYRARRPVPVRKYVARHPEHHLGTATG